MSKAALTEFQEAQVQQTVQNDARRIRQRVEAAQQNPSRAGVRWPFELLQNAHDAGPRKQNGRVEIDFNLQDQKLVVSHTGKPFDPQELAALLSGGSSKEFDDAETTGRFGTGFLVTHALSTHVDVDAWLTTTEGNERFSIELVRDGDEDSIIENINSANQSLVRAEVVTDPWRSGNPTANFVYHDVDSDVARTGLERLRDALPYLYATCDKLGRVRVRRHDETEVFEPGPTYRRLLDRFVLQETDVRFSNSLGTRRFISLRVGQRHGRSGLLIALEYAGEHKKVALPETNFSKLFVTFPIAGTDFLPFHVLLDGRFTPEQERDGILMNPEGKELITSAMSALPSLVRHGIESGWADAHKLADLSHPEQTFSGESDSGEAEWWRKTVKDLVTATAQQPIIDTENGRLPALSKQNTNFASFLVPSINSESEAIFDYEDIHELAADLVDLAIPKKGLAEDWASIARKWSETGAILNRLGVKELIEYIRIRSDSLDSMPVNGDRIGWLIRLMHLIGELGETYRVEELIDGIIPDQHGDLRDGSDLRVDGDIPEEIKNIASDLGIDLRSELLHNRLWREVCSPGNEAAREFIEQHSGDRYDETEAVDKILETIIEKLPESASFRDLNASSSNLLEVSARVISYLAGDEDIQRLRRCPLVTAADSIANLRGGQQILAPISHWPETQREYATLYTKNRIMSDRYLEDDDLQSCLKNLISLGLVIPAPLHKAIRTEVNDANLLNAMSVDGQDTTNITVRNESFGQIAFLSTDLVQRCGYDPTLAKLLLDFVLNVAAREDSSWRAVKNVMGTKAGEHVPLSIRSATWPFELKVRAWVPVPFSEESGQEGFLPYPASENHLRELDKDLLHQNDADARDLLHEVFGFERLDLMLASLNETTRSDLEELLEDERLVGSAVRHRELLQAAEDNPEIVELIADLETEDIQEIRDEIDERKRKSAIRETNRSFGHAAQAALADAIEEHGLELKLVDLGYDYEVFPGSLDEAPFSFRAGSYYHEVKATTTGDVRLTPTQAKTAAANMHRFVLCVIDLRGQELKNEWQKSDVEPYAKIVTGLGSQVVGVFETVDALTTDNKPVRLRNEEQLRYGLSTDLWENGISIVEWVRTLTSTPQPDTAP